ncbi:hypothetical protein ESB13_09080 [Filimonas effusa]|uniref:Uncharacterized protein n=2 Tax=Filimonas effusa TaxID=2508721 RepID=A0A4Q1DD74_9BACT|nr:hypothetical protein ESB13_09080 [Filimonas effusa]
MFPVATVAQQSPWQRLAQRSATLGWEQGVTEFKTPSFLLSLVKSSQTVAALKPVMLPGFDFTPGDSIKVRSSNGMYHLGDLNLRLRSGGGDWINYATAADRKPVQALAAGGNVLAAADLSATLPGSIPVQVKRYWQLENNVLVLRFELTNKTNATVEIGALGIPMIFNNLLEGKSLEQAHASNVFYDPYTGRDAGYLQVTRLSGEKPSLLVLPFGKTPFEAYNPLLDDPTPRGIVFEGFYEWMVHSKAYAETEWKKTNPWNEPSSAVLKPGESRSYGVQLVLCGGPKDIEAALAAHQRPLAVGIPGYVLPQDVNARLFLQYKARVRSVEVSPANALQVKAAKAPHRQWTAFDVKGIAWGRARLTVTYEDGLVQTIQYKVIKPEKEVIRDYGNFLTNQQWYVNNNDTFHRSPSVISYDNEKKQQVTQDNRAWIAGLSDEGGAGGWLGATMKQLVLPDKTQVRKLESFVDQTLWGHIQLSSGDKKYGVRKSLFYYEPALMPPGTYSADINFKTWSAWPRKEAESIERSYNYPHVAAAHWVLYRLAKYHTQMVTNHSWNWYLSNAFHTAMAMVEHAPYYAQFGQMEGSVFLLILKDLKAEGMTKEAETLEAEMKKRAIHWSKLEYPFGSEMPWDSTGQEEVYVWSLFFGFVDKAEVTIKAILAYTPSVPSWAYNGNARRYWDFLYGGKLSRIERMIHHYGSELNAIPLLQEYRRKPNDLYMLRVAYGGVLGGISTITEDGFAPCAFHSFPNTLENDGLSGDYGSGFYGYAVNSATYITQNAELGWLAFGGNLKENKDRVEVTPTTASRNAVYLAPAGLWLSFAAGTINNVSYNVKSGEVTIILDGAADTTPNAYLKIEQPASVTGRTGYEPAGKYSIKNGNWIIPLTKGAVKLVLRPV